MANGSRGDGSNVDQLLGALDAARMNAATPATVLQAAAKAWPSATAAGIVQVTDGTGSRTLEIRKAKEAKDAVYLKSSTIEGIHSGVMELANAVAKPLTA